MASDQQLTLPLEATPEDELATGNPGNPTQSDVSPLMARVLERENLMRALKQVKRNHGAPGIDGMTVEALPASPVREAWNTSKSAHGPWRISRTPALTMALPRRTFLAMGLPELAA